MFKNGTLFWDILKLNSLDFTKQNLEPKQIIQDMLPSKWLLSTCTEDFNHNNGLSKENVPVQKLSGPTKKQWRSAIILSFYCDPRSLRETKKNGD